MSINNLRSLYTELTITPPQYLFVSFNTTPESQFYLCRTCFTHICMQRHAISFTEIGNTGTFGKAINLEVFSPEHLYVIEDRLYGIACCLRCYESLGWIHVSVPPIPIPPFLSLRRGRVSLDLGKMVFWDGFEMLDAVTLLPI